MNLVFVNHCHPETPHVCAVRMREFANAMAGRGHRVVLVTSTLDHQPVTGAAVDLADRLDRHDWERPCLVPVAPAGHGLLIRARETGIGFGGGKALLAASYLLASTVHSDWRSGSARVRPVLAQRFRPDLVWGTFGNTAAWLIARDIAQAADCPWVADMKDQWDVFIPSMFRRLLAHRFSGATGMTALSEEHRTTIRRRFGRESTVVHSGVDPSLFEPAKAGDRDIITLTGSIYHSDLLGQMFEGIRLAAATLSPMRRARLKVCYAGHDHRAVAAAAARLDGTVEYDIRGQQPLAEWAPVLAAARLNCYVKTPDNFHHKLFDLLAAGRPIMTMPPESAESFAIALDVGGDLRGIENASDFATTMLDVLEAPPRRDGSASGKVAWANRAAGLEMLFKQVIGGEP